MTATLRHALRLFDHVDIVTSRSRGSSSLGSGSCRGILSTVVGTAGEVVGHVVIELLSTLLGTRVATTTAATVVALTARSVTASARAASSTTVTTTTRAARSITATTGDVTVNALASSVVSIVAATRRVGSVSVARSGDALGQGAARHEGVVKGVARGQDGQADGLAVSIGTIKLLDSLFGIVLLLVCNVSRAERAAGAVVAQLESNDGTDALEKFLLWYQLSVDCLLTELWSTYVEVVLSQVVVDVFDLDLGSGGLPG